MAASPQNNGDESDAFLPETPKEKAPPKQEFEGCCAPWKWFLASPLKRYHFLIFLIFGIATIVWIPMYFMSAGGAQSYILGGVACIVMSFYALGHFKVLLGLKDQVDKMNKLNATFRQENKALKQEIDKLNFAERKLSSVQSELGIIKIQKSIYPTNNVLQKHSSVIFSLFFCDNIR